ncbi:MAG: DUF1269 domain-containing protein [Anaerolineales bacterium]|nr:DUF1269 domain-containing protein [Anaerolineales bacterium]
MSEPENPIDLVIAAWEDVNRADEVLDQLREDEEYVGIWNAAVLVRDQEGKLEVKETAEEEGVRFGALVGAVTGAIVGAIIGGTVVGLLIGAGAGALSGKLVDLGFADKELKEMGDFLEPGTSAIIAVIEHKWVSEFVEDLESEGANILKQEIKER